MFKTFDRALERYMLALDRHFYLVAIATTALIVGGSALVSGFFA